MDLHVNVRVGSNLSVDSECCFMKDFFLQLLGSILCRQQTTQKKFSRSLPVGTRKMGGSGVHGRDKSLMKWQRKD